jgi:hydrogenase expression/formation protein HypE
MDRNKTESQSQPSFKNASCPLPLKHSDQIMIGHGSGGRMTQELIKRIFLAHFDHPQLTLGNDFATLLPPDFATHHGRLSVSTDAHIVKPLFFPGGDIGKLAVCGTVNDVAMAGALPLYLTASFIIEEGLSMEVLERIVASMEKTAQEAGVSIIAGDTKVAEKGSVDQLFISTSGIGWIPDEREINGQSARPGDSILLSGTMGDHGIAVLTERGELGFSTTIQSDVAPLNRMIEVLLKAAPHTHVLRDPTRGGVATTLNEIAQQSRVIMLLQEEALPVKKQVQAACEMLGFDPLYIANEGKLLAVVPEEETLLALNALRSHPLGRDAVLIGKVLPMEGETPRVLMKTQIGGKRILDTLAGELLPRIC